MKPAKQTSCLKNNYDVQPTKLTSLIKGYGLLILFRGRTSGVKNPINKNCQRRRAIRKVKKVFLLPRQLLP